MSVLGQQLINSVRAHAAEQPDFVYTSPLPRDERNNGVEPPCVYVHDGCPSCLIGQALFDTGVITAEFEGTPNNCTHILGVINDLDLTLDSSERRWLREVQQNQDFRMPWAEAVKKADQYMLELDADKRHALWNVA